MKFLGINLTNYLQDLYEKSTDSDGKKSKDAINGEISHIYRLNIVSVSVLPNLIYKIKCDLNKKSQRELLCGHQQIISEIYTER